MAFLQVPYVGAVRWCTVASDDEIGGFVLAAAHDRDAELMAPRRVSIANVRFAGGA